MKETDKKIKMTINLGVSLPASFREVSDKQFRIKTYKTTTGFFGVVVWKVGRIDKTVEHGIFTDAKEYQAKVDDLTSKYLFIEKEKVH